MVLYTKEDIEAMVERVADAIVRDVGDEKLVLVIILNGGMWFGVDLTRALEDRREQRNLYIDTMRVESYPTDNRQSGIRILSDIRWPIRERHVLVVDEVADTRYTLGKVLEHLKAKEPASLRIAVAIDKKDECLRTDVRLDYVGFLDASGWLVGYGMDDRGTSRGLRHIERRL